MGKVIMYAYTGSNTVQNLEHIFCPLSVAKTAMTKLVKSATVSIRIMVIY